MAEIVERVSDIQVLKLGIDVVSKTLGDRDVAGRRDLLREPLRRDLAPGSSLVGQDVTGNLLAYKLVIRLVGIERLNHVVAITIGLTDRIVRSVSSRVGIADQVQPVTAPALAILRQLK